MSFCVLEGGLGIRHPYAILVVFQHDEEEYPFESYQAVVRSRSDYRRGYSVNEGHRTPEEAMWAARLDICRGDAESEALLARLK